MKSITQACNDSFIVTAGVLVGYLCIMGGLVAWAFSRDIDYGAFFFVWLASGHVGMLVMFLWREDWDG